MHRKMPFILCALTLCLLVGCSTSAAPNPLALAGSSAAPDSSGPSTSAASDSSAPADPSASAAPDSLAPADPEAPTLEPVPTPSPEPVEPYEFGTPLEESEPVEDDSFFDTAVFLGDSRTEGLQLFSGLKHGDFFWARSMTVFRADSEDYRVFEVDGQKYSMMEALALKQYDNVYIMLGVNELGVAVESYETGLGALLDRIVEIQPKAVVYLQLMPPLNDALCRQNKLKDYINNVNLAKFNEVITRLAESKKVVLLNTAEVYTGEDGQLPAEQSNDGCHFAYGSYTQWADYLRTHTIDRNRYFANREQALAQQTIEQ